MLMWSVCRARRGGIEAEISKTVASWHSPAGCNEFMFPGNRRPICDTPARCLVSTGPRRHVYNGQLIKSPTRRPTALSCPSALPPTFRLFKAPPSSARHAAVGFEFPAKPPRNGRPHFLTGAIGRRGCH